MRRSWPYSRIPAAAASDVPAKKAKSTQIDCFLPALAVTAKNAIAIMIHCKIPCNVGSQKLVHRSETAMQPKKTASQPVTRTLGTCITFRVNIAMSSGNRKKREITNWVRKGAWLPASID